SVREPRKALEKPPKLGVLAQALRPAARPDAPPRAQPPASAKGPAAGRARPQATPAPTSPRTTDPTGDRSKITPPPPTWAITVADPAGTGKPASRITSGLGRRS